MRETDRKEKERDEGIAGGSTQRQSRLLRDCEEKTRKDGNEGARCSGGREGGVCEDERMKRKRRTIIEAQQGDMSVYAKRCPDQLFSTVLFRVIRRRNYISVDERGG